MRTIWRDDDIGARTRIADLAAVDDIFQRHSVRHTIAVMAAGMDKRPDLVEIILARKMEVQLHCWRHGDRRDVDNLADSVHARADLAQAADMLARLFGKRPTILYPTWNRVSPELEAAATALRLTVSAEKISLDQYVRAGGDVAESVVNFHYWHIPDVAMLDLALRIAADRNA